MAVGDYPCWVYDPTGVNPPVFVKDDPSYVALLNAPLPATAISGSPAVTTTAAATAPTTTAQPAPSLTQSATGTTVTPLGAKFTRTPTKGAVMATFFVNTTPHVAGKR